jgi:uncharacterized integral membrane protein
LVSLFALQNSTIVNVNFLNLNFQGSLAIVIIICYLLGVLSGFFYVIPTLIKKNITISILKDKLRMQTDKSDTNTPKKT